MNEGCASSRARTSASWSDPISRKSWPPGFSSGHGLLDQRGDDAEAILAAVEGEMGLVVADARLEHRDDIGPDIRRVRDDRVERAVGSDGIEQVPEAEIDAIPQAKGLCVPSGHVEGVGAQVDRENRAVLWVCAQASARYPDPVPTSTTRGASMPLNAARNSTTTNSESGRGISTAGVTVSGSEKNSLRPTR